MKNIPLHLALVAVAAAVFSGCATFSGHPAFPPSGASDKKSDEPKALLTWTSGPKSKEKGDGDDADKNGAAKKKDGDGNGGDKEPERNTIATDRPDFVEATSAVGKGRIQLEGGYTFVRDRNAGERVVLHSYPELLLRIGMFAEWFEFRIGQNFGSENDSTAASSIRGGQDLYLGMRFDIAEQDGIFPETSLIVQTTVPTGHRAFSSHQMLPGFNLLYGWEVIENKLTFAGSTQLNRRVDDDRHYYAEYAQAFTTGFKWTKRLGQYTEWFALVPCGANTGVRVEHYVDGGFTYLITDNFQLDIRIGVGLNRAADDFFAGTGFGIRY